MMHFMQVERKRFGGKAEAREMENGIMGSVCIFGVVF